MSTALQALAGEPTRATTSVTLSFGLINIPLSVYTGTETTRVNRREFYKGDSAVEVGRAAVRKDTGEVIESADVTRMALADNGVWVALSDDEIAACTSPRGLAEIVSFVPDKFVDQYLTENVYQVRPKREKGKANPAAERAYSILTTALRKRKVHALVQVAMRGPARYALLDSRGNFKLVYSADQVRKPIAEPLVEVTEQELNLATMLIDTVGVEVPVLTDTTAPVVQAFVNEKASGVTPPPAPTPPAVSAPDLIQQLLDSLTASKGEAVAS
jgi:DNA end-binding protein Ku